MADEHALLAAIDDFLRHAGISGVTLGRKSLNDPHFVAQLRKGRRVWPETEAKVLAFMATYRSEAA